MNIFFINRPLILKVYKFEVTETGQPVNGLQDPHL